MAGVEELKKKYPELLSRMEELGYPRSYVADVRREAERMAGLWEAEGWAGYADAYAGHVAAGESEGRLAHRRTVIRLIERFAARGQLPDGGRGSELFSNSAYHRLVPAFKAVIDCYREQAPAEGKKASTVRVQAANGAGFFAALQALGLRSLGEVTEKAVLAVFSPAGAPSKSRSLKNNVAAVLKTAAPQHPGLSGIAAFLPKVRAARRNIQYLTPAEVAKVKEALRGGALSLRDVAIGTLALRAGLRNSDIAAMRIDAVDWDQDVISLVQEKTGVELTLPLPAVVGNAIWDYLAFERPANGCPQLFVSSSRPHGRLKAGSMANIAAKIMDTAGIRTRPGDRRGFHLFRHHLATALLSEDVPAPVASRILGHTSPASLDSYLSADVAHLRECALSVEHFPVAEGVFGRG
ncbi:MAG: tyrosine-type recombinase/integrase [Bifidobacteriaceae bacterium]|nr:tyrosine-type recombinase/integrase [Bifidobacteriaceae bacterium]